MKKLLCIILLSCIKQGDAQILQWANNFGCANDSAYGHGVAHDISGNCIIAGDFKGTVDFNPGTGVNNLSAVNYYVCYLAKYDANGNYLWAFGLGNGSNSTSSGASVCTDINGNIFVTGYFAGTVDFNPGTAVYNLTGSNYGSVYVAKYDANGNFIWANSYGGSGNYGNWGNNICADANGNVIVSGAFQGTADFDPGSGVSNLVAIGNNDIFLAEYDANGGYLWAFSIPSSGSLYNGAQGLTTDAAGNVFISGYIESAADFDPDLGVKTLTPYGYMDIFIAKYDPYGNYLWAYNIGAATHGAQALSVSVDTSQSVFVTGFFRGTVDFDPGTGTNNLTSHNSYGDIFLAKFDSSGNHLWAFNVGSSGNHYDYSFAVTNDGSNAFITGCFGGTADFNPGPMTNNIVAYSTYDVFLAKYDANGNYAWAFNIGSTSSITGYYSYIGYSIDADKLGNVWLTGWIQNSNNDFDPNAATQFLNVPTGEQDIFIAKYNTAKVGIQQLTDNNNQLSIYPNPTNGNITIQSSTELGAISIYNALGQKIIEARAKSQEASIDISNLPSGIYTVQTQGRYIKMVKE